MHAVKSLGIIGGTFNPIHYGHLVAAECAREAIHLDKVIFVPSARPPHKDWDSVLDGQQRYEMVQLAVQDNPYFIVSRLELDRKGMSYTVDTIDHYLQEMPGVEIYFILGLDAFLLIDSWKEVERLAGLCNFVVVTRPGYILDREDEQLQNIPSILLEKTILLPIPGLFISSSEIRTRVTADKSIKYLMPPAVEKYIQDYKLYEDEEFADN